MPPAELPPVFVLAAGLGTRLGFESAKTLFPVAGRPLLGWILVECERQGASRVTVTVLRQHAQAVREFCLSSAPAGLRVSISVDDSPLGTLGTLRAAWASQPSRRLVVWLGDVAGRPPLRALDCAAGRASAVLLAHRREDYQDSGVITVAPGAPGPQAGRRVTRFAEKPGRLGVREARVWAGVAVIAGDALTAGQGTDLGRDLWPRLAANGECQVIDSDPAVPLMAVDRRRDAVALAGQLRMASR